MTTRPVSNARSALFRGVVAVAGLVAIAELTGCHGEQGYRTASFDGGRVDILEASDVKAADVGFSNNGSPQISDHQVTILKVHVKLTGDKETRVTMLANQLCVETTKSESKCKWGALTFFANAGTTSGHQEISHSIVQIDGQLLRVVSVPAATELSFALKPRETNEAELIFSDVTKAQAKALHFGSMTAVRMKPLLGLW